MLNKKLIIYYLALLVVLLTWKSISTPPALFFRMAFLLAVIVPGILWKRAVVPSALICFWGIASNSYAYTYMPSSEIIYLVVVAMLVLFSVRKKRMLPIRGKEFLWIFWTYILVVNFVASFKVETISQTFLILLLFFYLIREEDTDTIKVMELAFMVMTIGISVLSLSARELLMSNSMGGAENQRIAWVDPNYLGIQVGLGALVGLFNLFERRKIHWITKVIGIIAVVSAFPTILMTGSRGAILSLIVAFLILFVVTDTKLILKLIVFLSAVAFCYYLYTNDYFELLLVRMQNDDGTGSGRLFIWQKKIETLWLEGNVLNLLFGYGLTPGMKLGFNKLVGFHNDFLAFFCCYGLVGMIMLLKFLLLPYQSVNKHSFSKYKIIAGISYIAISMMTLEPLSLGIFTLYSFFVYMLLLAKFSVNDKNCLCCTR